MFLLLLLIFLGLTVLFLTGFLTLSLVLRGQVCLEMCLVCQTVILILILTLVILVVLLFWSDLATFLQLIHNVEIFLQSFLVSFFG